MEDKHLLVRKSKEMGGNFFVVSAGFKDSQLVFSAYDKTRELLLELKIKWSMAKAPTSEDVMKFVERLDTQSVKVTGNSDHEDQQEILVLKA